MRLGEIFRYEVGYQLRRLPTWFYFAGVVGLVLIVVTDMLEQEAKSGGNLHTNAPFLITFSMLIISMMGLAVTAALFGDAAARDAEVRMHPLFYTAPLTKLDYLGGRFLGAFTVNALLLAAVPLGLIAGELFYLDRAGAGPFRLDTYLHPFFAMMMPNLFVSAAIVFTTAALTRRPMMAYGGGVLLFLGSILTEEGVAEQLAWRGVASLVDPFGFTAMSELIQYWTPAERNAQLVGLGGMLLWNRVAWLAVGTGVLALLGIRFRFAQEGERSRAQKLDVEEAPAHVIVPVATLSLGAGARIRQTFAIAWHTFGDLFKRAEARVILALGVFVVFASGWGAWNVLDTPTWPVTYIVARSVIGAAAPLIYLLIALYAGELVWRERDARTNDIVDAMPLPNWVPLAGKFLSIVFALVVLQSVLMAGGILLQTLQGYTNYEPALYVQMLFGFQLPDYLLWAALAMLLHVLANHKYVAHFVLVLYFAFVVFARDIVQFGLEHNMLLYPAAPAWTYSDMSGFEPFLEPYLWFKLYWGAWALVFAVIANVLWVRGRERRVRFTRPSLVAAAVSIALLAGIGGYVFYNTNVLNEYRSRKARIAAGAEYEKRYKQYERLPQPVIARADLRIELYPERRTADLGGTYLLENRTGQPIDSVHLILDRDLAAHTLTFDRKAARVLQDDRIGYHVFRLAEPFVPGQSMRLRFGLRFAPRGFTNEGANAKVVANGTYIQREWFPIIGYQPELEMTNNRARGEAGLPPKNRLPPMNDPHGLRASSHFRDADSFWFSAVIGTSAKQTAIAPGSLRRTWSGNGRRYFHYESDVPIRNHYPILSAEYAVRRDRWNGIPIEIWYHPAHTFNVDRILRGAKAALQYHAENFAPYQHKELRIVEFPRHGGTYARANPGTITNSEGFGFIARPEEGIDYPSLVAGHEVAHQWWGHQLVPARVEGGPVLAESMAHYGTLMVAEKTYGRDSTDRFRELLLHKYLIGRQNSRTSEVPLLRSNDQKYIHYDKGALVMYALRDAIGEQQVNTALRRLLLKHRFGGAPYATTRELYAELQAVTPEPLRYLLVDLMQDITLWELRTTEAKATPAANGTYRVTLRLDAQKVKADAVGRDRPAPMNDVVDIGVYGADGKELYLRKHRIRSGAQTVVVTVPKKPARAGIDPRHVLLEKERGDNVRDVM